MKKNQNGRRPIRKALFSTLSNQTRLDILLRLNDGEKNVTQLVKELRLGQPLISYNLGKLAEAGFLHVRKAGNFRFYALNKGFAGPFLEAVDPERHKVAGRDRNALIGAIFTHAPVSIFALDAKGMFTFVGGDVRGKFGMTEGDLLGKSIFTIFKDRRHVVENARRALGGHSVQWTTESKGRILEVVSASYKVGGGRAHGVIGVIYDVTDRVEAENKLRDSERRWKSMAESSSDFLAHLDRDGIFLEVNHTVRGLLRDKVIGTAIYDYLPKASYASFRSKLKAVFKDGKPRAFFTEGVGPEHDGRYECRLRPLVVEKKVIAASLMARRASKV